MRTTQTELLIVWFTAASSMDINYVHPPNVGRLQLTTHETVAWVWQYFAALQNHLSMTRDCESASIAAYGKAKDHIRFYEINPAVIRMASDQRYFTFLSDSPAKIEIIPGDARLSMQRELDRNERQDFDVLVIDAFSGDAIPIHLLTQEAFAIYLRQLRRPSGILAIHITNAYLDLRPVVVGAAEHFGYKAVLVNSSGDGRLSQDAQWMLVSQNSFAPASQLNTSELSKEGSDLRGNHLWTDGYSNLLQILKR